MKPDRKKKEIKSLYNEEIELLQNIKKQASEFNELEGWKIDLSWLIEDCDDAIEEIKREIA